MLHFRRGERHNQGNEGKNTLEHAEPALYDDEVVVVHVVEFVEAVVEFVGGVEPVVLAALEGVGSVAGEEAIQDDDEGINEEPDCNFSGEIHV